MKNRSLHILGCLVLALTTSVWAVNRTSEQLLKDARKAVDAQMIVPLNLHLAGGRDFRFSRMGPSRMFQAEFAEKGSSPYIEFTITFFDRTKKFPPPKKGDSAESIFRRGFEEIAKGTYDPSSGTISIETETGAIPVTVFVARQKAKITPDKTLRLVRPKTAG